MKKIIFALTALTITAMLYVVITSLKKPDKKKYYYAFNKKNYLEEIPDKFIVKVKDNTRSANLQTYLRTRLSKEKIKYQDETSFTVDVKGSGKNLTAILNDEMGDVEMVKPAYKYQNLEMDYTDEIMVEPNDGVSINEVLKKTNLATSVTIKKNKFYALLKVSPLLDACDVANTIQESGLVKYSHPNFMIPVKLNQVIPNDTYFNNQFYLHNTGQVFNPVENHFGLANADINAIYAWNITTGSSNIIVAVLDEGVTSDHPDLPNTRQVRLNGSNFIPGENPNDPSPGLNMNHGNACAGIIAATQNNNEGISGIAPNVKIMPIKILGQSANATTQGFTDAIDFAWQHGADVISNSWGLGNIDPNVVPSEVQAINRAVTQGRTIGATSYGCVVVFGAGNNAAHSANDPGFIGFPANVQINGVITVGASDRNDIQADYSATSDVASPSNQIIDIVAPSHKAYSPQSYLPRVAGIPGEGYEVWSIDILGAAGYNPWNDPSYPVVAPAVGETLPATGTNNLAYTGRFGGTSAAAPQVAAVAALLLSLNSTLTQQQVFNIITQSAEKVGGYTYNTSGWCPQLGYGRLNACAALTSISNAYSINGPDRVCVSETYSVQGLSSGSTVQWVSSDPTIASVAPTGVVTKNNNGTIVLTANITPANRCGTGVTSSTKTINVGSPSSTDYSLSGSNGSVYWCPNQTITFTITGPPASNYNWTAPTGWTIIYNGGTNIAIKAPSSSNPPTGSLSVSFTDPCGVLITKYAFLVYNGNGCSGSPYTVSPNPASTTLTISCTSLQTYCNIAAVQITDMYGNVLSSQSWSNTNQQVQMPVYFLQNGTYIAKTYSGTQWYSNQFIVHH